MASSPESLGEQEANASSAEGVNDQEAMSKSPGVRDKRKRSPSSDGGNAEQRFMHPTSPSMKKNRTTTSGKDHKGCNCKNSRCLKCYCDCFATEIFCSRPACSCQGCLNVQEHQGVVLGCKKEIQSRNPRAFFPKTALQPGAASSGMTSSSNTRGCNCKHSMCEKNYCQCYRAKVGCSNACNCQGCKNKYGTKENDLPSAPLDQPSSPCGPVDQVPSNQVPSGPAPTNSPPPEDQ